MSSKMWIVVHFIKENSIEAVPNTWYNSKEQKCARLLSKNSVKRMIKKRIYPNKFEFKLFSARNLGHPYTSLFEARSKGKKSQFLSDLSSENEDYVINRKTKSTKKDTISSLMTSLIPNPPSLVTGKKNASVNVEFNTVLESEIDMTDSDPEYVLIKTPVKSPNTFNMPVESQYNFNSYYIKSPIGKILVENDGLLTSVYQKHFSGKPLSQSTISTPVETVKTYKRALFMSEPPQKFIKDTVLISETNSKRTIYKKKEDDYSMPPADFQKFVISSLTKIKYDLTALSHTVNACNMILESGGKLMSSNLPNMIKETLLLEKIFPIKVIGELENLEQKIKDDKQFRLNIISKLTLLVETKSVGDSVRRIMSKMFEDNVLLE
ncbi:hypothetical protein AGLY_001472 [Aphis glycines]|uniref:DUF4806 domain-containing protein n=1 Tax=Aphis glycines TaxID=307491 RepID=A0A6G0U5S5_APHGL|nr:hypothetical protein AGLY_001472 [Aphis glycines]